MTGLSPQAPHILDRAAGAATRVKLGPLTSASHLRTPPVTPPPAPPDVLTVPYLTSGWGVPHLNGCPSAAWPRVTFADIWRSLSLLFGG